MALSINGTTGISGVDGSNASPAVQGSDSNTGLSFGTDIVNINTAGTERARVDANGAFHIKSAGTSYTNFTGSSDAGLVIGSSSNDSSGIMVRTGTSGTGRLNFGDGEGSSSDRSRGFVTYIHSSNTLNFGSDASTRMTIDSIGRVLIGGTSPVLNEAGFNEIVLGGKSEGAGITLQDDNGNVKGGMFTSDSSNSFVLRSITGHDMKLRTNNTNRVTIGATSGDVNINNTGGLDTYRLAGSGSSVRGVLLMADGRQANTTNDSQLHTLNRLESDGQLITFSHNGSQEGSISSSGSTISYNGGHLSRWSQLKGISSTDKSARPTIYQGTVMSNLDDLCQWSHSEVLYEEDVLYTEGDTIPEGKSVGDIKHAKGSVLRAAYTEENQQLNMTKISDTVGDKDVAGVFWAWDDEDDEIVNDFYIAMTGDMVIRVAASTTVARGDLLISAGDGTAKPQDDDIVRSSTIAKIISTTFTATYEDGSKAYPCVLMAC